MVKRFIVKILSEFYACEVLADDRLNILTCFAGYSHISFIGQL
jgi:hypothetical protein